MGIVEVLKQLNTNMETSLKVLQLLTKSTTSEVETVTVTVNGETFRLPSISFLLRKIKKLEDDIAFLHEIKDKETFSTIFAKQRQLSAPKKLSELVAPAEFIDKPNYLLENFLNPVSYVRFNLTADVSPETKTVLVNRCILELDTAAKEEYFLKNILNQTKLDYSILEEISAKGIAYQQDIETVMAEPSVLKFVGEFDVVAIDSSPVTSTEFNFVRKYTLNKVTYTDTSIGVTDNLTLKTGDVLVSNDNTFYQVVDIDVPKGVVTLGLKSGFKVIDVGVNQLRISSTEVTQKYFDVSIGNAESQIIFIKTIDPYYHTISNDWSFGVGVRNSLLTINKNGEVLMFSDYQTRYVQNYVQFIKQSDVSRLVFLTDGLQPLPPILNPDNFKVLPVNQHRHPKLDMPRVRQTILNKEKSKKEIDIYQAEIARISALLTASPDNEELQGLYSQYNDILTQAIRTYNTTLDLLKGLNSDLQLFYDFKPKYRIRGFWAFPPARVDEKGNSQEVIQFVISYRYLNQLADQPVLTSIPFFENDTTTRQGVFSDWIEISSPIRKKVLKDGVYVWEDQKVEDPSQVNVNQLDIPISYGEKVEIRIKSISEAGYPTTFFESDWSPSVTKDFPAEYMAETPEQQMIKDIQSEIGRLDTLGEIDALREVVKNLDKQLAAEKAARLAVDADIETRLAALEAA